MSEGYILELKESYNDQTTNVFTTEEWFKRLDNGDNCHSDICRLLWERDNARAALSALQEATRVAIDNCETCRGETDPERKCARCQTFEKLLKEAHNG